MPFGELTCVQCRHVNQPEHRYCQQCGADLERHDAARSPQHRRRQAAQPVLDRVEALLATPPDRHGQTTVTAEQYISYFMRALERGPLDDARKIFNALQLEDMDKAGEKRLRADLDRIIAAVQGHCDLFTNLHSISPPPQFAAFHALFMGAMDSVLDVYRHLLRAAFAMSMPGAVQARADVQASLDRVAEQAHLADAELRILRDSQPPSLLAPVDFGALNSMASAGSSDAPAALAEALAHATRHSQFDFQEVGRIAQAYMGDLLTPASKVLTEDQSVAFFATVVPLAGYPHALTVKARTRLFLEILHEAHAGQPAKVLRTAADCMPDLLDAGRKVQAIGEQLAGLDAMSQQAQLFTLAGIYGGLTESVWRRLINLVIYAMFVAKGNERSYSDISEWSQFGDKVTWLEEAHDPRFDSALAGISRVCRNGDAHGDVEVRGDRVIFTSTRTESGRRHKQIAEFTEDELVDLMLDTFSTCWALSAATSIFQIEHLEDLRPDLVGLDFTLGFRISVVRMLLGLWHLTETDITLRDDTVVIVASVDQATLDRDPAHYIPAMLVMADGLPTVDRIVLEIAHAGETLCRVEMPAAILRRFKDAPEEVRDVVVLRWQYAANISGAGWEALSPDDNYVARLMYPATRMAGTELVEFRGFSTSEEHTPVEVAAAADRMLKRVAALAAVLRDTPPPGVYRASHNAVLSGLREADLGLRAIRRGHLERGLDRVDRAIQTLRPVLS